MPIPVIINGQKVMALTLEEWMAPLAPDHPAKQEFNVIKQNAARAMEAVDALERRVANLKEELARKHRPRTRFVKQRNQPRTSNFTYHDKKNQAAAQSGVAVAGADPRPNPNGIAPAPGSQL